MLTVACVYRSGGPYTAADVERLARAVRAHLPVAHRFVCLTDRPHEVEPFCEAIPLVHGWPGWWSKMELYEPGKFDGPVLYFDLDTVIAGDLSPFASYTGERAILRDMFRPDTMIQTAMWIWNGDALARVWHAFTANAEAYIAEYTRRKRRSDQFTMQHIEPCDRIQDLWPGAVVSFKAHCIGNPQVREIGAYRTAPGHVPEGARVVIFHGQPRPSGLPADHWIWQHTGIAQSRAA